MKDKKITLSGIAWNEAGSSTYDDESDADATACLIGAMQIGTSMFHVEAIAVEFDGNGIQGAIDPCLRQDFAYVSNLCGDGPLETIKIKGYNFDYVVAIYPFAK